MVVPQPWHGYRLELNAQFFEKGTLVGRDFLEPCLREDFEFYLQPEKMIETWGRLWNFPLMEVSRISFIYKIGQD